VLRASRGKGAPQKSGHKAIYFISQILGSKTHNFCGGTKVGLCLGHKLVLMRPCQMARDKGV